MKLYDVCIIYCFFISINLCNRDSQFRVSACRDSLLTEVTALKSIIKQFNYQKFDDDDSIRYEECHLYRPDEVDL